MMKQLTRVTCLSLSALLALTLVTATAQSAASSTAAAHHLMPVPAKVTLEAGGLLLDARFTIAFAKYKDVRLEAAAGRLIDRLTRQTGIPIVRTGGQTALTINCAGPAPARVQRVVEDERYALKVTSEGAVLDAATPYGVLRGLATFAQLVEPGPSGFMVRAATIEDEPRFPWRGLLIDSCRHWLPVEVIERNLDAMAAVKLNVLHWHLSEDQGFRVESLRYPKLHRLGSDGHYYTQAQIRHVVRYAADRGIRVVPEFDIPGHTGSWLVGYPELSAGQGPFELQRTWGIFDPVLDPTKDRVYTFLDRFLGEMAALFPDAYFHIGGDEVNGRQWKASPAVQAFMKRRGFKTIEDVHAYFNRRIAATLKKYGKTVVGWDEILHPDLPKTIVVQSWRGQKALAEAARLGYRGILSNGYYLDYQWPAARHYAVDPMGKEAADLPEDAKPRVLGGEACMWAEWVTPETVDSRIWPRAAAVAERFWSPVSVTDAADMYRRLWVVSQRLTFTGITHRTAQAPMIERLLGNTGPVEDLGRLVNLVEPVREYNRGRVLKYTSLSPLTHIVDAAWPESQAAQAFAGQVEELAADPARKHRLPALIQAMTRWQESARVVQPLTASPQLREAAPLVDQILSVAAIGLRAAQALETGSRFALTAEETAALDAAAKPVAEVLLMVTAPVKRLAELASR